MLGGALSELRALDRVQRATFLACLLGWTLDAFDFFLMVFVIKAVATEFNAKVPEVAFAVTLTLAMRPLGAFVFGRLADRFGRRPVLMVDISLFAVFELASAFAPSLTVLLILRALFGFAMGGEWGIGASLTMESIPASSRGIVSGILQEGYALGYLLAALVYGLLFDVIGWRGLFAIGVLPALLVVYVRRSVPESPAFEAQHRNRDPARRGSGLAVLKSQWRLLVYLVLLMTCFNFFSHGSQDLFPTFLQTQRKLSTGVVSTLAIVANLGAIAGGILFGHWSQHVGRRRAIVAAALLALPVIPLWAFSMTPVFLGLGAFLLQFAVQGAWGVVPVHLNELSPPDLRGTLPGVAYQLGNLIASVNATIQSGLAEARGGDYAFALATTAAIVAVVLAVVTWFGPEARDRTLAEGDPSTAGGSPRGGVTPLTASSGGDAPPGSAA